MTRLHRTILILCFLLLLPIQSAAAQQDVEPLTRFEHLTVADGLADNSVLSSMQDSRGFLWFGTVNGLSRYDGYTFKTYVHDSNDPNSLLNNNVADIVEDADGTLWLATGGGITQYDPLTETFSPLTWDDPTSSGGYFTIFIDSRGDYWFGGGPRTGLTRYRPNSALSSADPFWHIAATPPGRPPAPDAVFTGTGVQEIVETADGQLWIAAESQLVAYDPTSEEFRGYPLPDRARRANSVVLGENGRLWLAASSAIFRFDPDDETFDRMEGVTAQDVHELMADGTLWASNTNSELIAFDTQSEAVVARHAARIEWDGSLGLGRNETLTLDRDGQIWVGTQSGVSRLDPQQQQFTWHGYTPADNAALPFPEVTAVLGQSDTAAWWIANPEHVTRIEQLSNEATSLAIPPSGPAATRTLFEDQQGSIWFGAGNQMIKLDPETFTIESFPFPPLDSEIGALGNRLNHVFDIASTADGKLWATVFGIGLLQIDPLENDFRWVLPSQERGEANNRRTIAQAIISVANGANDTLWLGFEPTYIQRFDPATNSLEPFSLDGTLDLDSTFSTQDMYEDVTGIVWLATTAGLLRLDPTVGSVEKIDGLPTDALVSIAPDRGGNLWLGSTHGLLRYRIEDGEVTTFGVDDGLPSVNFSTRAAQTTPDGQLLFGTDNGMVGFYAEQIRPKSAPPAPLLTDLQLFNQSIPLDGTLLSTAIWNTDEITLASTENSLSFEFAAPGYMSHENLRYRYRMNGLDDMWTEVDSDRRFVTFGQMPPGNYTFELQSGSRNGEWNEDSTTLAVTIIPAWWQRTAVQVGAVALLIGAISLALWQRSVRLKNRNDELNVLVAEQTSEIADSEARFRGIAAASFEAILVHDAGEIIDANGVAAGLFGISAEKLIGCKINDLGLDKASTQQLIDGSEAVWESDLLLPDGRTLMVEGRGGSVPYRGHEAQVAALRDVTERREREAERQRLVALEERERIGRDLHDDLGQVMSYLSIQAQTMQQQLGAASPESISAALQQLTDVSREAHHNIRRYILGIRSEDDTQNEIVNLRDALQLLTDRIRERHALNLTLILPPDLATLSLADEVEAQLLRIVQEALMNVVKHADTDRAHVVLTIEDKQMRIAIVDEGQGFDTSQSLDGHYGLSIMRERAESVGGSLTVESAENRGTQVVVLLPHLKGLAAAASISNIRTLIVDDHPLYRDGLRNLLITRGIDVVGMASNGVEAQAMAAQFEPDLILMDIDMPQQDGLETTRLIHEAQPDIKIIMLTVAANEERLLAALRNGAVGYLLKSLEGDRFFASIAEVMQGETVMSPTMAAQVLANIAKGEVSSAENAAPAVQFSDRQLEVLALVMDGFTNKEVGAKLFITVPTVKYHIRNMLEQLQLENRRELVRYARKHKLV